MTRPIIGVDMDGVICRPPLGLNINIGRGPYEGLMNEDSLVFPLPAYKSQSSSVRVVIQTLKYLGRRPMPEARAGLLAIKEHRDLVLITSRSGLVHRLVLSWLSRNGMLDMFEAVYTNDIGLPSPEFKWHMVSKQGVQEFIDDDGRVADFLARRGLRRIYLQDWPRNRGYQYPDNVIRVGTLREVAKHLAVAGS